MKKVILLAAVALGAVASQAQTTVAGSKFTDNWSVTLKGGAIVTTQHVTNTFWGETRGVVGLELRKQITPVFGLGVEGEWTVNTSSWTGLKSANVFDHQYVGTFGTVNFMNAFAGYAGAPRLFELEAVAGVGWLHSYYPHRTSSDGNSWGTKVGLNFNFNLGKEKAWTIAFKPAYIWNMNGNPTANNLGYAAAYNSNNGALELEAGVTYHFGNSNGTHSFVIVRPYDQNEVDALNAQINALRADLDACGANNAALQAQLVDMQAKLDACNRRPAAVEKVVNNLNDIRYVFFNRGSSVINANQQPNIAMVANQLKDNNDATVSVQGYASKDGSLEFNKKLAQRRAEAVKKELVKKYGISANRVNAEGMGVGDLFEENNWNRVSVLTVNE
jgi:outer membrane protein OmpA-like peptidoglycan-associated protein